MTGPRTRPTARQAVVAAAMAATGIALAVGARWSAARTLEDARLQTSEVAERLGGELQATAATARRHAERLAQLRAVRVAVETDRFAAQRVMRTDALVLTPAANETIELFQLPRGGKLMSLLRAPARARALQPRLTNELRVDGDAAALTVLVVTPIDPLYVQGAAMTGAVAVATKLPIGELVAPLADHGFAAQLLGLATPLSLSTLALPANARLVSASVPLPPGARPLTVRVALPANGSSVLRVGRALLVAAFVLALWTLVQLRRRRDEPAEARVDLNDASDEGDVGAATIRKPIQDQRSPRTEALTVPSLRLDAASRAHLLTANVPEPMEDEPTEKQTSQGHLVLAWSQPMPTPITHLDPPPTAPLQLYTEPRADLLSGSYRLLHLLGRGAAADVYLAQCFVPGAPSTVALKLLAAGTLGGSGERFLADARRQLRVTHPNVVQVHDVGVERIGYVAMEYVEGCTLAKLMDDLVTRDEPLPLPQTVAIIGGIVHALEAAQQAREESGARRPLVHGAVKPSNVLIGRHGAIKLGDFGAPPSAGERRAPEQYAGKPADRRSDVYALGVILHELTANRHVFAAPPRSVTSWPPLPAPSSLRPELPHAVDAVVARATRFGPRGRYADAAELLDELQHATAHAAARERERPSGVLGDWVERARRSS